MSEVRFWQTRAGRQFYERTIPDLVRQLQRIADLLERLLGRLEERDQEDANE